MIQTLEIQNRQSHAQTRLDFHEGVNLLIGRGTSGKSAILRALRWAVENTSGEAQISDWIKRTTKGKDPKKVLDGESSVTITKPEGTLKRFRNTESNGYTVNGRTLKAVGTGVPDEVVDFFNLSDVNIQGQFDGPFLISLPGSQVSSYLNRVVGIEEIDRYLTASTSCIREARKAHTALMAAQEADTKALEALSWVDGIQGQLDALDALDAQKQRIERKLADVATLRHDLAYLHAKAAKAAKVVALADKVADVRKLAQASTGVGSRLSSVSRHIKALEAAKESKERASKVARLWPAFEALEKTWAESIGASARLDGLTAWVSRMRTVKGALTVALRVGKLEPMVAKVRKVSKVLAGRKGDLASLQHLALTIQGFKSKLEAKRSEVSELEAKRPETCPLCGGDYGKECK